MDFPRRRDDVFGVLDRHVGVVWQADAYAIINFHPIPPDAWRGEERGIALEGILQAAPAHSRLDRRHPSVAERNLITGLELLALAMQAGEGLLGELNRRCQSVPLGVDAAPRLFFFVAAEGEPAVERSFQKIDIGAVERARQGRVFGIAETPAVVKRNRVEAERLRVVLPAVTDRLTELNVLGVQRVTFGLRVVEDRKS